MTNGKSTDGESVWERRAAGGECCSRSTWHLVSRKSLTMEKTRIRLMSALSCIRPALIGHLRSGKTYWMNIGRLGNEDALIHNPVAFKARKKGSQGTQERAICIYRSGLRVEGDVVVSDVESPTMLLTTDPSSALPLLNQPRFLLYWFARVRVGRTASERVCSNGWVDELNHKRTVF